MKILNFIFSFSSQITNFVHVHEGNSSKLIEILLSYVR